MPNCTLSLEMLRVTDATLPMGSAWVQSDSVVSRITTSYPVRLVSGLAFQSIVVRLVPEKVPGGVVWICAFLGVLGEEASPHKAAEFTRGSVNLAAGYPWPWKETWSLARKYRSRRQISRMCMPVRLNGATELTNRPSCRDSPSFSPPT